MMLLSIYCINIERKHSFFVINFTKNRISYERNNKCKSSSENLSNNAKSRPFSHMPLGPWSCHKNKVFLQESIFFQLNLKLT